MVMLAEPVVTTFACDIELVTPPEIDMAPLMLPARSPMLTPSLRLLPSLCIPRHETEVSEDHSLTSQLLCPILRAPDTAFFPSHPPCKLRLETPVTAMFLVVTALAIPISIVIASDIVVTAWPEVIVWR
jgi:hypothetical protein